MARAGRGGRRRGRAVRVHARALQQRRACQPSPSRAAARSPRRERATTSSQLGRDEAGRDHVDHGGREPGGERGVDARRDVGGERRRGRRRRPQQVELERLDRRAVARPRCGASRRRSAARGRRRAPAPSRAAPPRWRARPRRSRGRRTGRRARASSSSSRHIRVVGCAPVPNAPAADSITSSGSAPSPGGSCGRADAQPARDLPARGRSGGGARAGRRAPPRAPSRARGRRGRLELLARRERGRVLVEGELDAPLPSVALVDAAREQRDERVDHLLDGVGGDGHGDAQHGRGTLRGRGPWRQAARADTRVGTTPDGASTRCASGVRGSARSRSPGAGGLRVGRRQRLPANCASRAA